MGYETTRKACTNPKSYSGLVTGTSYTLKAWAIDAAGNPDGSPATSTFSVQTLPSVPNHKAVGAERFTDFTAVGTHFAYSDTGYASGFADLKSALCDMDGVEHIRDRAILYGDPRTQRFMAATRNSSRTAASGRRSWSIFAQRRSIL